MISLNEIVHAESLILSKSAKYLEIANASAICANSPAELAAEFRKKDLLCFTGRYKIEVAADATELEIATAIVDAFFPVFNSDLC